MTQEHQDDVDGLSDVLIGIGSKKVKVTYPLFTGDTVTVVVNDDAGDPRTRGARVAIKAIMESVGKSVVSEI